MEMSSRVSRACNGECKETNLRALRLLLERGLRPSSQVYLPHSARRKWQESNETTDSGRQTKTGSIPELTDTPSALTKDSARTTPSPSKTLPRGNGSTPRTQVRRPLHPHSQANQQRLNSPVKAHPLSNQLKAPSSASFNPEIYNAPAYPIARPPGGDPSTGHSAPNLNATRGESNILVKKGSLAAPLLKSFHPRGTNPAAKSGELTTESAGIIIVPTNDGRVLRIDPFTTTPAVIDSWTEVSDEAKKAAKEEAVAIISSQMAKWTIGT